MHLQYPTIRQRIARLLVEEVIPPFGVPESLLSDRSTKMLCKMLGIEKLNNTAYHPQCDGAVEKFNRTLKTALGSTQHASAHSGDIVRQERSRRSYSMA